MRKHIPMRMCVICRQRKPKQILVRHIFGPHGTLEQDAQQRMPGRGVYVCDSDTCREKLHCFTCKKKLM